MNPPQQQEVVLPARFQILINTIETFFRNIYPLGFKDEALIIVKTSIPLVLSILSNVLFQMMSIFFCGHLGSAQLAGVSLAGTFINVFCNSPLIGLASASDTLMPQLFGSAKKQNVGIILQKGCIISLLLAIPCIGLLLNARNIMTFVIDDYEVLHYTDEFIRAFSPSIIFISQQIIVQRYLQAQNILYPVLAVNLATTVLNAIFHYIFVFLLGLGVKGSGIALVLVSITQIVVFIIYIVVKKIYTATWPGWSLECLYDWQAYLKLGLAGMLLLLLDWAFFEIAMIVIATLGSLYLSVMAISLQTLFVFFVIPFGIGYSGNIRVGQLLGENKPNEAINSAKVVLTISLSISFVIGIILLIFSNKIPFAFTNDIRVAEETFPIMKLFTIVAICDGLQICGVGLLRSVGAQKYGLIIAFIGFYVVAASIGYPLLFKTNLHIFGFWVGYCFGALAMFIAQMVFISKLNWVQIAETAHKSAMIKNRDQDQQQTTNESAQIDNVNIVQAIQTAKGSLKSKMIKKSIVFIVVAAIFIALFLIRDLRSIESLKNRRHFNHTTQYSNTTSIHNH